MRKRMNIWRNIARAMFLLPFAMFPAHPAQDRKHSWNFDSDKPGAIAAGFTNEVGEWKVVANETAPSQPNALAQVARSARPVFNIALIHDTSFKNLDVAVKFNAIAGEIDQGGGIVWRARDAKNYYIARYNPLEDNYRVYKVEDGRRSQLGSADVKRSQGWHTIRVVMTGDRIECYYDGRKYLELTDRTFAEAGRIGLWTKADAGTQFDDLTVRGK